ncbi:MAG: hypothetical protein ACHP8B_18145 [Terriglobales bacterium]
MPRPCSICKHPERAAIDSELFRNGTAFRNIAERFKVAVASLHRHKQHVPVEVQKALRGEKLTAELPPKKQRYIEGVLAGKSKRQAALDAGFSESMASHATTKIETKDVQVAFAALIRESVPPERISKVIAEGLAATDTKVLKDGTIVPGVLNVAALAERRACAELAAEYGGYHTRDSEEERAGGGVILILPRPSQPEPEDRTVVEAPAEKQSPIVILPKGPEEGNRRG